MRVFCYDPALLFRAEPAMRIARVMDVSGDTMKPMLRWVSRAVRRLTGQPSEFWDLQSRVDALGEQLREVRAELTPLSPQLHEVRAELAALSTVAAQLTQVRAELAVLSAAAAQLNQLKPDLAGLSGDVQHQRQAIDTLYGAMYELAHDADQAASFTARRTVASFAHQWQNLPEGRFMLSDPWFREHVD